MARPLRLELFCRPASADFPSESMQPQFSVSANKTFGALGRPVWMLGETAEARSAFA